MTCPNQYTENNAACIDCIFCLICKEDTEYMLHQQAQSESDLKYCLVHDE